MATTAVGLFSTANVAESVADALRANGIPTRGIRILAKPESMSVQSATSTPGTDFIAALSRDLRSMGAVDGEIHAYISGVQSGNVLVFATGTLAQADAATAVMNAYSPIEVEEFIGAAAAVPSTHVGDVGPHDISSREERTRAKTDGARLFSW